MEQLLIKGDEKLTMKYYDSDYFFEKEFFKKK